MTEARTRRCDTHTFNERKFRRPGCPTLQGIDQTGAGEAIIVLLKTRDGPGRHPIPEDGSPGPADA